MSCLLAQDFSAISQHRSVIGLVVVIVSTMKPPAEDRKEVTNGSFMHLSFHFRCFEVDITLSTTPRGLFYLRQCRYLPTPPRSVCLCVPRDGTDAGKCPPRLGGGNRETHALLFEHSSEATVITS